MLAAIDIIFILVYFIIILLVGFRSGIDQNKEDYLIAGRNLKSLEATTTIFSSRIGAAVLITYTALVYFYGLGAIWYFIGSVFGLFIFYFFGKELKKLGDKHKFYTLSDYFFHMKGPWAGYLSSLVVIVIMFGWVVMNFTAGAKLIHEYTPISYALSVIIIGVVILLYLLAGGFRAVVKTDIIQTLGIFLLFGLMLFLLFSTKEKPKLTGKELFNIPTKEIVNFFLAGFFIPLASPELFQRVYAIKDQKHFRKSLFFSSVFYLLIGVILLLIGLIIKAEIGGLEPDSALIVGFSRLLPAGLSGLSVIIIYSAVSSSADTYLFTSASAVTQDFIERIGKIRKNRLHLVMRITMVIMMSMGVVIALLIRDIVDLTFFFVSLTMSLGFLILILWLNPKLNKYSVQLSILFCLLGVVVPTMLVGISTQLVMYAVGSCILGLILGFFYNLIKQDKTQQNQYKP